MALGYRRVSAGWKKFLPELAEVPEAIGSKNAEVSEVAEPDRKSPEVRRNREGPERLVSFCLFKKWSLPEILPSISSENHAALVTRIHSLRQEALEVWGAGFYSHGEDKALYYQKARAALGGIVGLIHGLARENKPQESLFLEQEVLPALSALIRAVKRPRKFRGKPEVKGSEP